MSKERDIDRREHQDDPDIYEQSGQEVMSKEQDVDADNDSDHRKHV